MYDPPNNKIEITKYSNLITHNNCLFVDDCNAHSIN